METLKQESETASERMNRLEEVVSKEIDEQVRYMNKITEYQAKLGEWGCANSEKPWSYGGELTIDVVVKESKTPRKKWDNDAHEWVPAAPRQPRDESFTFFIDMNVKKPLAPANYSGHYAHNPIDYVRHVNNLTGYQTKITNERDIKGILNMGLKLANDRLNQLMDELDQNANGGL